MSFSSSLIDGSHLFNENRRPVANAKQRAHDLIERLSPTQLNAVVDSLESLVEASPGITSDSAASAPPSDKAEIELEHPKVQKSKAWFQRSGGERVSREEYFPHAPRRYP
jgi:hypothetical protein